MIEKTVDVVIIGSGAGGGTAALELLPLVRDGRKVLVLAQGQKLEGHEFNGREVEMAPALYEDQGGFLTAGSTMTLAFGRAYGGSTVVYTGTSMFPPERVIHDWDVPHLQHADLDARARKFAQSRSIRTSRSWLSRIAWPRGFGTTSDRGHERIGSRACRPRARG